MTRLALLIIAALASTASLAAGSGMLCMDSSTRCTELSFWSK